MIWHTFLGLEIRSVMSVFYFINSLKIEKLNASIIS